MAPSDYTIALHPCPVKYIIAKALRENLRALLLMSGKTRDTIKARYLTGPKAGKVLSSRTIGYVLSGAEGVSGLSVDGLGALAGALGVEAYHLLVPGLDPLTQPAVGNAETWIEAEVERRLAARWKRAGPLLKNLEAKHDKGKKPAGPDASHPWPHLETPTEHRKRKASTTKARAKQSVK